MLKKAVLLLTLFASPALAQEPQTCMPYDIAVKTLTKAGAQPVIYFLSEDGKQMVMIFANESTSEWIAMRRTAGGPTCMIDAGIGFGVLPEYRGPGI